MAVEADFDKKKSHSHRHAGRKAEKKAAKKKHVQDLTDQQRNPKAFAFQSAVRAQRKFVRSQDIKSKKHHIPLVDRTPLEPPPVIVAVVGGPKVGKSTLLRCLIKNYTNQRLSEINGPVTVVVGKKKRLTFIEVNNDINCMIDIAKVADVVLMLIDATFGIEMEIFEFLEICRAHGSPRIIGILNHLDMLKDNKSLKKRKKALKNRFQVELYPGAKLFYLSGCVHDSYLKNEVKNLGRFVSVMKFRPLAWRTSHPYILVDRYEDITNEEKIRINPKCDRDVVLYGYVRGVPFQKSQTVHIPGCGDYKVKELSFLPDPCPLPEHLKKRSLNAKERLTYAPMSGVGGVVYDKDAVYIDLGGSHHGKKKEEDMAEEKEDDMLQPLLDLQKTADEKQAQSQIQIFANSEFISGDISESVNDADEEYEEESEGKETDGVPLGNLPSYETVTDASGRVRRRAVFSDDLEEDGEGDSDEDNSSDEGYDEEEDSEDMEDSDEDSKGTYDHLTVKRKDSHDESQHSESEERKPKKIKREKEVDEYDIEGELKSLKGQLGACENSADVSLSGLKSDKEVMQRTHSLKSNKDTDIASKIKGILDKIKATDVHSSNSRTKNDDRTSENKEYDSESDSDTSMDSDHSSSSRDKREQSAGVDSNQEIDSDKESEDENAQLEYRTEMFKEATDNFYKNQCTVSYLRQYIYGDVKEDSSSDEEEEEVGGLFRRASRIKTGTRKPSTRNIMNDLDTSRYIPPVLSNWSTEEVLNSIRDTFVTGEWKDCDNAQTLLKMDDEDEDLYGDFEDLELGKKFTTTPKEEVKEESEDKVNEDEVPEVEKEKSKREKLLEKKRRLKEMFDSEYDDKGSGEHFDSLKAEMTQQAQLNRSEFEGLDDEIRVQYEGFRPGMYVRMEFEKFPCEFITNFDASYPVIIGGLLENESNMGFVQVRIKVHRWYPKILKNRDPLILSLGWRRFQTVMFYAKREDNFRMRSLKYARKYLHIEAMFWGPVTTVNTGFVALQNVTDRVPNFRIAANGVVLETEQSSKIVKKLKLLGHPENILKKTAFIKDMFHSGIEVAKFEGAKIQTQSGIRGIIKKSKGDKGLFRATFEDGIKMSDVVILKTWVPVELVRHCFSVKTLLLPPNEKASWQGMRTVAEIKKEKGVKNPANLDSLYTPITSRREYIPMPQKIPRQLQKALPYDCKPKILPARKEAQRVLVVKDPHEVKMDDFMKRLKTMMSDKIKKEEIEKQARKKKFKEDIKAREHMRQVRERRKKAAACRYKSKKEGKKSTV